MVHTSLYLWNQDDGSKTHGLVLYLLILFCICTLCFLLERADTINDNIIIEICFWNLMFLLNLHNIRKRPIVRTQIRKGGKMYTGARQCLKLHLRRSLTFHVPLHKHFMLHNILPYNILSLKIRMQLSARILFILCVNVCNSMYQG